MTLRWAVAWLGLAGFGVAGCGTQDLQFTPNHLALVEAGLTTPHREQIAQVLVDRFGTPDEPLAPAGTGLDLELLQMAAGAEGYVPNQQGGKRLQRGLYRQYCASCHGITGDGYGPAAAVLAPYPRDFRPGVFKYKSTYLPSPPTAEDLRRVLVEGVAGTAMPSFALLEDRQLDALVEYVTYLSIRGQVERELIAVVADEFDYNPATDSTDDPLDPAKDAADRALVDEVIDSTAARWAAAEESIVLPDPATTPPDDRSSAERTASRLAGRRLFASKLAKCTDCHGQQARGLPITEMDDWNRRVFDFRRRTAALAEALVRREQRLAELPQAQRQQAEQQLQVDRRHLAERQRLVARLLEPQVARPRDLQDGVFRGGSRPLDLFRRLHQGIAGTPMPAFGSPRPGVEGTLSDQQIWQLVDHVRSLSRPEEP